MTAATKPALVGNKIQSMDRTAHDWYRFVLSFPPHLVRTYLEQFDVTPRQRVLDPFCGTGTTLVECKKLGIPSIGIDSNPIASFASRVKTDWTVNPERLSRHAERIAEAASNALRKDGIEEASELPLFRRGDPCRVSLLTLPPHTAKLLLKDSISPLPLHKVLVLIFALERLRDERLEAHERLALAKSLVTDIGNLHFGPEVGIGRPKSDAPAIESWLKNIRVMADDLSELRARATVESAVYRADSREVGSLLGPNSIDAVITSPPYPNEKDYTRTTRLESVLLGFLQTKEDLRQLKEGLVRSNTRGVFKHDRDHEYVSCHAEIQRIARAIEKRRVDLGKTSGFERLYSRVARLYFGGVARHLSDLRLCLRPGARLAYVVGDQASYLRVMIRTGQLLADIATSLGYELEDVHLFRTRLATATREQLREEVVILRWPGTAK